MTKHPFDQFLPLSTDISSENDENRKKVPPPSRRTFITTSTLSIAAFALESTHLHQVHAQGLNVSKMYLPWSPGKTFMCTQGNDDTPSHKGKLKYAFDFGLPSGEPILAAAGGTVSSYTDGGGYNSGWGNYVVIDHGDGTYALYGHMQTNSVFAAIQNKGQQIQQGQQIGRCGSTGNSTGTHIHIQVMNGSSPASQSISFTFAEAGQPVFKQSVTSRNYRPPIGFTYIANEGSTIFFSTPVDVAFGVYPYYSQDENYFGNVNFSTKQFGDPARGVPKFGFYKPFFKGANENGSNYFDTPVTVCYGANGRYSIYYAAAGTITFNNSTFGDPNPGTVKAGYYTPFTLYANENQTVYIPTSGYVAYGAKGKYSFRYVGAGWITFNNSTFGDPNPGTVKTGWFRPLGLCHI